MAVASNAAPVSAASQLGSESGESYLQTMRRIVTA